MRPEKNIEKTIKNFDIDINPTKDQQILNELQQAYTKSKQPSVGVRRVFMKRISVPVPIAAGFLIIFCVQLVFQFIFTHKILQAKPATTVINVTESSDKNYSEQSVYVPGTGFTKRSKTYNF